MEAEKKEDGKRAPEKTPEKTDADPPEKAEEAAERAPDPTEREILAREVMAVCPPDLQDFARGLLLKRGMTFDQAREEMKDEYAKRQTPAGTSDTEPTEEAAAAEAAREGGEKFADEDKEPVSRGIFG